MYPVFQKTGFFGINSVPESELPTQTEKNTLKCPDFSIKSISAKEQNNK
jgi:hypothetical protein